MDDGLGYTATRQAQNDQLAKDDAAAYAAGPGQTTAGKVGNVIGQIATSLPFIETGAGLAGGALGAGAAALGGEATVAGRAAQAGATLATGAGAPTIAGRVLSSVTSGALKGSIGGVATSDPDQTGADAGWGALLGAGLGPVGLAAAPLAKGIALYTGKAGGSLLDMLSPAAKNTAAEAPGAAAAGTGGAAADAASPDAGPAGHTAGDATAATPSPYVNGLTSGPSAPTNPLAGAADGSGAGGPSITAPSQPPQAIPTAIKPQGLVLTQGGAGDVADKLVRLFAQGGPTAIAPSSVLPAGAFDAAEATGNPGLAALKTYLTSSNPGAGNLFAGIKDTNNAARMQVLSGIMGTPADVAQMEAARDAVTSQAHDAAFSNAQPVDIQPFSDQLQTAIDSKKGYPSVQKPLLDLQQTLQDVTQTDPQTGAATADPEHLWNVRQQINAMISPKAAGTAQDGRQAAAQLIGLKPGLDATIEQGAPGFGNFIKQYSDLSAPIDGMNWLQKQGIGITDSQGNITLAKLDSTIKTLQRQQEAPGANTADGVTPDQQQALIALRENLRQAGAAVYKGRLPGSDTFRNLGSNSLINAVSSGAGMPGHMVNMLLPGVGEVAAGPIGTMLGSAAAATRYGANALATRGSNMVTQELINRLTNPAAYQKAVNPLAGGGN
ncbi:hypothetical protein [Lichenicola cladoniae]|uniref:hypothetical protein n=1 Tax=Lichenicola cladoniae TaxID=1484109 RepID=UPI001EF3F7C9|nr:hypothetical protein [Lichenicola cladoniae]